MSRIESDSHLRAQAAVWCVRLNAEDATEADFQAFERWLGLPGARAAYDSVEALWGDLDRDKATILAVMNAQDNAGAERRHPARFGVSRRVWLGGGLAAAAVAALAVFIARQQPEWTTYTAPIGETRTFALADGTAIQLNTNSSLRVVFTEHSRRAAMAEGEISFDVAHDDRRPFVIEMGSREVEVLGTEFNIQNYGGRFELTVRRGLVAVSASDMQTIKVPAGQQLVHGAGFAPTLRAVDPALAFSWQSGLRHYADATLAEIVADLNRYFVRPISLENGAGAQLRFSGTLALGGEDQVVSTLEKYFPVRAVRSDNSIVLQAKTP